MSRILLAAVLVVTVARSPVLAGASVWPTRIVLDRPESTQQMQVTGLTADGRPLDLTRSARYTIADPNVAAVDSRGRVVSRGDGTTRLQIVAGDHSWQVTVDVRGQSRPPGVSFEHEVIPILTKARCNAAGCHGKAEGQNGLKLSVFGHDPAGDHRALTMESRQRRVVLTAPASSLLVTKSIAEVPHGGGRKIQRNSPAYHRLLRWIGEGARFGVDATPVTSILVRPQRRRLLAGESLQLQVTAVDGRGRRWCVTDEADFESNTERIATVDADGEIRAGNVPGEAVILVRYMGQVATCRVTRPRPEVTFPRPPENNFIDGLTWNRLEGLGVPPSGLSDDAMFLRRVFLDTIGTLPTSDEARRFLVDPRSDRRSRLVERLLVRPEYADYRAMRWADILRVDRDRVSPAGAVAMTRWLRSQFATNRPYDAFAREILTARGDTLAEGPASLYRVLEKPEQLGRSFSQLFLGIRIECAQCHHHPFEKWSQSDYVGFAGFFTGLKRKSLPGGNQSLLVVPGNDLKHARTGEVIPARPLGGEVSDFDGVADRRGVLADWMTSASNPFFARAIANRLWAHYFGRGLVEPIDDMRATNPAVNVPLLDALAAHLVEQRFDLRAFTRTLLSSRVYQLSNQALKDNADDLQNFSHAMPRALPAEVLLDAICQVTGVPEKFNGWPRGYRAIQIWDNRMPSYFFRIFGRPVRASVCECERSNEPSIAQALHLINSPEIQAKLIAAGGTVDRLARSDRPPAAVIDELFLTTLSRFPQPRERKLFVAAFETTGRTEAIADCLWALLNSKLFLYNH
ncbi:MAG: hypothetical protein CMJ65_15510 [Planctomycetaceae bacterium]|nr:hypothetical protein [Planctomycetaceae bacterium]